MKRLLSRRLAGLAVLACLSLIPSCGPSLPPLVPVSGKVTLDGKPFTQGELTFRPEGFTIPNGLLVAGTIDANGQYTVHTAGKEGAPAGKYKVTVIYLSKDSPTTGKKTLPTIPFNKKFADPRLTPLAIEVKDSAAAGAYDLKLTK